MQWIHKDTFGSNSGTSVALFLYVNKLHDICFVTVMTKHIQLHNWTEIIIETHWFCGQEMFGVHLETSSQTALKPIKMHPKAERSHNGV